VTAAEHGSWTPAAALDEALHHQAPALVTEITGLLDGDQVIRLCKAIQRVRGIDARSEAEAAEQLQRAFDLAQDRLRQFHAEQVARLRHAQTERFGTSSRLD
jgi:hypothetical protein